MITRLLTAFILFAACAVPALADPQPLGTFGGWSAYENTENGQKLCYVSSRPVKSSGDYKKRGAVFAEVTHRPAEHRSGVFNILAGYMLKPKSPATLRIGDKGFSLFTHGDAAFAQDSDDPRIVAAMRAGGTMVLTGTSSHGTATTDSFDLKGMDGAYAAASKACGVVAGPAAAKSSRHKAK